MAHSLLFFKKTINLDYILSSYDYDILLVFLLVLFNLMDVSNV